MKHIAHIITIIIAGMASAMAQQQTITVDPSKMSQTQFAQYKALLDSQPQSVTADQVSEWAEAGKAMGGAFKECWSAISTDVERFANSPAGTWTAVLVTWKVAGRDLIGVANTMMRWIFSFTAAIVFTAFMAAMTWKNCVGTKRVLSRTKGEGKDIEKIYDNRDPIHARETIFYCFAYFAGMLLLALCAFAGV